MLESNKSRIGRYGSLFGFDFFYTTEDAKCHLIPPVPPKVLSLITEILQHERELNYLYVSRSIGLVHFVCSVGGGQKNEINFNVLIF
ncbi:hypothetical protein [Sphingobacterium siyangense]|uniref:hypothetical protein n=1 Tax=Sphingobacterium siyangense TaxID=459529 RepID=UPI003C759E38